MKIQGFNSEMAQRVAKRMRRAQDDWAENQLPYGRPYYDKLLSGVKRVVNKIVQAAEDFQEIVDTGDKELIFDQYIRLKAAVDNLQTHLEGLGESPDYFEEPSDEYVQQIDEWYGE